MTTFLEFPWGKKFGPQEGSDSLRNISHASILTVHELDGTCIDGPIAKAGAATVVVQPYGKPPVTIPRLDLFQISQGDALIFSLVSSWANVDTN